MNTNFPKPCVTEVRNIYASDCNLLRNPNQQPQMVPQPNLPTIPVSQYQLQPPILTPTMVPPWYCCQPQVVQQPVICPQPPNPCYPSTIVEQQFLFPGCTYTHDPLAQQYALAQYQLAEQQQAQARAQQNQSDSLRYHIALKELEKQCLETVLMQEHLKKNPYCLQFHQNATTTTADLNPSKGLPDYTAGLLQNLPTLAGSSERGLKRLVIPQEREEQPVQDVQNVQPQLDMQQYVSPLPKLPPQCVQPKIVVTPPSPSTSNQTEVQNVFRESSDEGCQTRPMKGAPVCYTRLCRSVCCVNNRFNAELEGETLQESKHCHGYRCMKPPTSMDDLIPPPEGEDLGEGLENIPIPKIVLNEDSDSISTSLRSSDDYSTKKSALKTNKGDDDDNINHAKRSSVEFHPNVVSDTLEFYKDSDSEMSDIDLDEEMAKTSDIIDEHKKMKIRSSISIMRKHKAGAKCTRDLCNSTLCNKVDACNSDAHENCEDDGIAGSYCQRQRMSFDEYIPDEDYDEEVIKDTKA